MDICLSPQRFANLWDLKWWSTRNWGLLVWTIPSFSSHGSMAVCDIHSVWAVLLVILNKVEVCPLFAALRVFCHTQHIRNMHATWRVARPRNAVIYDVSRFFRSRDVKKVELHLKDWLSRKCAEKARNIVNYSVAWRATRHVACMLRMCCAWPNPRNAVSLWKFIIGFATRLVQDLLHAQALLCPAAKTMGSASLHLPNLGSELYSRSIRMHSIDS